MLNNTVLDVVVGLIFIFLMFSAGCSLLNERIQSILEKRSKMLGDAIQKLLGDDAADLFQKVKEHSLISSMSHSKSGMPSYIPASTFTHALFDTLVPHDGERSLTFADLRKAIGNLPDNSRKALLVLTHSAEEDLAVARANVERWFDHAMDRLSGAYKRHVTLWLLAIGFVLALATNADCILLIQRLEREGALRATVTAQAARPDAPAQQPSDPEKLIDQVQQLDLLFWDTDYLVPASTETEEAAKGADKAKAAADAAAKAAADKANAAADAAKAAADKAKAAADAAAKEPRPLLDAVVPSPASPAKLAADTAAKDATDKARLAADMAKAADAAKAAVDTAKAAVDKAKAAVKKAVEEAAKHPRAARRPELSLSWMGWLVLKLIGCLLTALAASFGAPFWFDLLGRVVNLRATGATPPKAAGSSAPPGAAAPGPPAGSSPGQS